MFASSSGDQLAPVAISNSSCHNFVCLKYTAALPATFRPHLRMSYRGPARPPLMLRGARSREGLWCMHHLRWAQDNTTSNPKQWAYTAYTLDFGILGHCCGHRRSRTRLKAHIAETSWWQVHVASLPMSTWTSGIFLTGSVTVVLIQLLGHQVDSGRQVITGL